MAKYSVKKPFTVLVGVILVLVLGVVSLMGMNTDLLPSITLPYLVVVTTYPGASPERVEEELTRPLESSLGTVNGVENVTSTSGENYSMVMLEFADDTDMDSAMVKTSTALNQLADTLPETSGTPMLLEITTGTGAVLASGWEPGFQFAFLLSGIAFGGLSTLAQTSGMIRGSGLKLGTYFRAKLLQGLLTFAAAYFWLFFVV